MPWIQISLHCTREQVPEAEAALQAAGANAITLQDAEDQPILEPEPGETPLWDNAKITGLYAADQNPQQIIALLTRTLPWADVNRFESTYLEDQPWERAWLEHFKPLPIAKNLWIVPSNYDAPDKTAVNVILDPGLAFGTGTHPTTALCLQWLAQQELQDKMVIDYGCGSGILAIAAALLGAQQVYAVDLDPQALIATQDNAQRNNLQPGHIQTYHPNERPALVADVLVANILAAPLQTLSPTFQTLLRSGGKIALSGILETQANTVQTTYQTWCRMDPMTQQEDWIRLSGTVL